MNSSTTLVSRAVVRPVAAPPSVVAAPSRTRRLGGTSDAQRDLLLQVAAGDQVAFGDLFDRIGGRVYGVARRVLRDPAQAEEVTQDVLAEVWCTAGRFDPFRGSAGGWILTIAHHRAVDRVRSEQAARVRTRRVGVRDQHRAFDEVTDQVILHEEHAEVRAALAGLPGPQREAIELVYRHGHTFREAAELLDTPLGTIKTRMRVGLLRLRKVLEAQR